MKFKKYESITNSYQQKFIDLIVNYGLDSDIWYVQEKVHGANFSLTSDGSTVRAAKRTCFIADDDNFYGSKVVRGRYDSNVLNIAKDYEQPVTVYGELCGGFYDGKTELYSKMVQRGVQYCPYNDFLVFDIRIGGKYVEFKEVVALCAIYGLKVSPVLFKGTFKECLDYPNEFNTKVPAMYGLNELEDNICEGTIVRPNEDRYLGIEGESSRIILKNKNSKFTERDLKPLVKLNNELTPELQQAYAELQVYVNENRLDALVSKHGEDLFIPKNFGKILGLFLQDIYEEVRSEDLSFFKLEQNQRKTVQKLISGDAVKLLRKKLELR
jgi:Rnl2 family RNA ligase